MTAENEKNQNLHSTQSEDLESGQINHSRKHSRSSSAGVLGFLLLCVKRNSNGIFKVILILSLASLICGCVWYTMGIISLLQVIAIAFIAYLFAGGGYRFLYVVYKTGPRDIIALIRYLRFLWSVRSYSSTDASVADIFRGHVKKNPNKVLLVYEDREWTGAQIEEYSNKVANAFKNAGIRKGDAVALMMNNKPEFVCIWLGLSKIGAVTALINHNLRKTSLAHCVNIANCTAFIFELELLDSVKEIKDELQGSVKLFCWTANDEKIPSNETWASSFSTAISEVSPTPPVLQEKVGFHDKLVYIYTSGTTGLPKAAVVTHSRYLFLAGAIRYQLCFSNDDRFYTPLPLYHTAGGAMSIGQAVLYGSCVVIRKKFSASAYFPDIVKYNCTVAQYIGEMCRYILSTPPKPEDKAHKLKVIFGNGLRPQIWKEFVERFNIPRVGEFYGATEGNANIVNTDNTVGAIGFVSQILPSVYPISIIKVNPETGEPVRNSKGLCIRCQPGEQGVFIGKIISSNPARAFLGYVNKKDSEKKVVTDVFEKGDSAFLSGDIVVSDEFGYLYFKDRTGDTFRWKGENVSTSEVEAIVSNVAEYRDCVVYGVEIPGTEGRAGMAAILDENNTLDLTTLVDGLKKNLPSYAIPLFVRILSHVEMTGTYKMKKIDLQKEGFNPELTTDKIYFLNINRQFELLTPVTYADILAEKIRF
ncbi:long-chain fatty acid transport protein 1-like [Planococcus citri]|uniref:long-chain fatty acid transport protein 1-like n=1 Tax=Planococcus citri TaxID=170843 RepID=UPI0031F8A16D